MIIRRYYSYSGYKVNDYQFFTPLCFARSQGVPLLPDMRKAPGSKVKEFTESVMRLCAELRSMQTVWKIGALEALHEGCWGTTGNTPETRSRCFERIPYANRPYQLLDCLAVRKMQDGGENYALQP